MTSNKSITTCLLFRNTRVDKMSKQGTQKMSSRVSNFCSPLSYSFSPEGGFSWSGFLLSGKKNVVLHLLTFELKFLTWETTRKPWSRFLILDVSINDSEFVLLNLWNGNTRKGTNQSVKLRICIIDNIEYKSEQSPCNDWKFNLSF